MIFLFLHYTRTKEPRTWQNGDGVVGRERRCPFLVGFSSQIAAGVFPLCQRGETKKTKDHHRSTPRNEELAKWFLNGENQSARSRVSLSDLKHSRYWRFLLLSLNSFVSVSLALPFYSLFLLTMENVVFFRLNVSRANFSFVDEFPLFFFFLSDETKLLVTHTNNWWKWCYGIVEFFFCDLLDLLKQKFPSFSLY